MISCARRLVPFAAVVVAVVGLLAASPAGAADSGAADSGPEALWFWRWSDGGEQRVRTVTVGRTTAAVPGLVASVVPAASGERVVLQFLHRGRWRTEDVASTDDRGVARLDVNPFCPDGDWCRREFRYRLVAGGRTAALTVRFTG